MFGCLDVERLELVRSNEQGISLASIHEDDDEVL